MTTYALVPVRVKIGSNSAAEIDRAQKLVKDVVGFWQEMCSDAEKNGMENAAADWIYEREPTDPIEVITE